MTGTVLGTKQMLRFLWNDWMKLKKNGILLKNSKHLFRAWIQFFYIWMAIHPLFSDANLKYLSRLDSGKSAALSLLNMPSHLPLTLICALLPRGGNRGLGKWSDLPMVTKLETQRWKSSLNDEYGPCWSDRGCQTPAGSGKHATVPGSPSRKGVALHLCTPEFRSAAPALQASVNVLIASMFNSSNESQRPSTWEGAW